MEKSPQSKSKGCIFQKAFFLNKEKIITKKGPKPAINTGRVDIPAPAFICKKKPIKGASIQITQETKFGLVFPWKIVLIYQREASKFTKTPTKIIFSGSIPVLKF